MRLLRSHAQELRAADRKLRYDAGARDHGRDRTPEGWCEITEGHFEGEDQILSRVGPAPHDPTSALRTVIQLTLRTDLRRVLGGCPIEQSGLRENLRTIGAHARRHQLHAEQLLVLIKDACAALPEGRELLARPDKAGTLNRLISMAVDEYYRP